MARYRKIDVRIHDDEKVRRLSQPTPNGKYLFTYLLTCRSTTSIPGLFCAGEAQLAEELGWPLGPPIDAALAGCRTGCRTALPTTFRQAWLEVAGQGLVMADWEARVVWVPNAFKYNRPESPSVVVGWRIPWDEVPECPLKLRATGALDAALTAWRPAWRPTWLRDCGQVPPHQDQDQDQDQEDRISVCAGARAVIKAGGDAHPGVAPRTGYDVLRLFGLARTAAYPEALPWNTAADRNGKASTFAAGLTPDDSADLPETMRLFWLHVQAGVDGYQEPKITKHIAFAFGLWVSRFPDLVAEIHGKTLPEPPQKNGHDKRDIKRGMAHYDDTKPIPETGRVKF
jgi:hypothetical protein